MELNANHFSEMIQKYIWKNSNQQWPGYFSNTDAFQPDHCFCQRDAAAHLKKSNEKLFTETI